MNKPALAAILVLAWTPALAAQTPRPGPADPRIRAVDYDPWQVVKLMASLRTATQVLFGQDETILQVALGDSADWEVAAQGASLFLKPKAGAKPTNMLVTTQRSDQLRHYSFDLSVGGGTSPGRLFVLRFRYLADEKRALAAALASQAQVLEQRLVGLKLEQAATEGHRNLAYAAQGSSALQPSEVSDNGRFTVLRFPADQALPAIYQVDASGVEALAAFDVRGEFVVVHGVFVQLRLRRGRDVLCLYNEAYNPYGVRPQTGTAAPDVERTLKALRP